MFPLGALVIQDLQPKSLFQPAFELIGRLIPGTGLATVP